MKQDIARTKQQAYRVEITTTPRQPGVRRIAKKVAAKAKSREKEAGTLYRIRGTRWKAQTFLADETRV